MRYQAPTAEHRELFHRGENRRAYEMLGAHPVVQDGHPLWHFALWAPNAKAVWVTGEFCHWEKKAHAMVKQYDGIWELRLPAAWFDPASDPQRYNYPGVEQKLRQYKYVVEGADGVLREKTDPYAFEMQLRPNNASLLCDLEGYAWQDASWMEKRKQWDAYHSPVNIYELHLGSWRRREDGTFMSYEEIAAQLVPYVQDMGYTHVELLPVMEHPLDMSWGYQVTGYFAATSRYGTPKELMKLIDALHQAGIGVILDWVPAHFPKDEYGLRLFDGSPCYEHADPRRAEMPQWGTCMFDYARGESCSFLLSSACFWLEWYHADGIRVDAVSAMLYHDFCKEPGQWLPNKYGGRENLEAVDFLRRMNATVYHDFPGVMMVAEEATAYPMVTKPAYMGGLGFGFKWNMGWMNDILKYVAYDPVYRKYHHDKLTFSLMYAFSENYVLPFSHDEVVHGKHSMLDKQPGDMWQQFAGLRALYGYTMAHPGKKLLFMGSEFAQYIEWKFDDQLDWFLLLYEKHPQMQACVRELNRIYRETPALWEVDDGWDGFQWVAANDSDNSVVAFIRTDRKGNSLLCVTNFTPVFRPEYRIGLPYGGTVKEFFNTDSAAYCGSNQYNAWEIHPVEEAFNGFDWSCNICVPPLSTVYYTYEKVIPLKPKAKKRQPRDGHAAAGKASEDAFDAGKGQRKQTTAKPSGKAKVAKSTAVVEAEPTTSPKPRSSPRKKVPKPPAQEKTAE